MNSLINEIFLKQRSSGTLLHISSLPSRFGIGDLGPEAYAFVDFLESSAQHFWQILPLNPTDPISAHSPYSSMSAFASNRLLISPEMLVDDGWIEEADLEQGISFSDGPIHFDSVSAFKLPLLKKAFQTFKDTDKGLGDFEVFKRSEESWLHDYSLFMAIKEKHKGATWLDWPLKLRNAEQEALEEFEKEHANIIEEIQFFQFLFDDQWRRLREYANTNSVGIIGDIPIYVQLDSADVWSNKSIFKLNSIGHPEVVAGVPPDAFSDEGQRWGNPVYDWSTLKESSFEWWLKRIERNLKLYDAVRIDHFRGLVNYWEIPVDEQSAKGGKWVDVPADDFFMTIKERFPEAPIIAEDLGIISDEVRECMTRQGFPGMKILQFAFNGDMEHHPYLPHNYEDNCIGYSGTHDNDTLMGWLSTTKEDYEIENIKSYFDVSDMSGPINWIILDKLYASRSLLIIIPVQDFLALGSKERMNRPGTTEGNWLWRLKPDWSSSQLIDRIASHLEKENR